MKVNVRYDKATCDSEEEYSLFVSELMADTVTILKQVLGDDIAVKNVISAYLERGYKAHFSSEELVDFFCVSTPSILDELECSESEADEIVKLYDETNISIFPRFYPEKLR